MVNPWTIELHFYISKITDAVVVPKAPGMHSASGGGVAAV